MTLQPTRQGYHDAVHARSILRTIGATWYPNFSSVNRDVYYSRRTREWVVVEPDRGRYRLSWYGGETCPC